LLFVLSPKSHCQEVGSPVVVSANWIVWPGPGVEGLKTNVAPVVSGMTVRVLVVFLDPDSLVTVSATLRKPGAAYV